MVPTTFDSPSWKLQCIRYPERTGFGTERCNCIIYTMFLILHNNPNDYYIKGPCNIHINKMLCVYKLCLFKMF